VRTQTPATSTNSFEVIFFIRKNISLTKEKSTFGVDFFAYFRVFVRVPLGSCGLRESGVSASNRQIWFAFAYSPCDHLRLLQA
jgi:hypothetical protein